MNLTCDHCGKPIVRTNCADRFLVLAELDTPGDGLVTDVAMPPELDGPKRFHDMRCLAKWAAKQVSPYSGKPYADTPLPEEMPR